MFALTRSVALGSHSRRVRPELLDLGLAREQRGSQVCKCLLSLD
jgi:hypothetical protein